MNARKPEPTIISADLDKWLEKQGMASPYASSLDSHGKTAWQLGYVTGILREILNDRSGLSRKKCQMRPGIAQRGMASLRTSLNG